MKLHYVDGQCQWWIHLNVSSVQSLNEYQSTVTCLLFLSFQLLNKVTVIFPAHLCSILLFLPLWSRGLWYKWNLLGTSLLEKRTFRRHFDKDAEWHGERGLFTKTTKPTKSCRLPRRTWQYRSAWTRVCVHIFCFILFYLQLKLHFHLTQRFMCLYTVYRQTLWFCRSIYLKYIQCGPLQKKWLTLIQYNWHQYQSCDIKMTSGEIPGHLHVAIHIAHVSLFV